MFCTRVVEHSLGDGGFSGIDVRNNADVANGFQFASHDVLLVRFFVGRTDPEMPTISPNDESPFYPSSTKKVSADVRLD